MKMLRAYLEEFSKKANAENIKIDVWGDMTVFDEDLQKSISSCIEKTKNNTGICLNICLNYGGRNEIVTATRKIAEKVKSGEIDLSDITEETVSENLYSAKCPDPDLMIRTSNEFRTSGFLPWQMTYTEFVFIPKYWPDFNEKDLDECIEIYKKRNRKFGVK